MCLVAAGSSQARTHVLYQYNLDTTGSKFGSRYFMLTNSAMTRAFQFCCSFLVFYTISHHAATLPCTKTASRETRAELYPTQAICILANARWEADAISKSGGNTMACWLRVLARCVS